MLKGRARALAAAGRTGSGPSVLTHWTALLAYSAVLLPVAGLLWLNWQKGFSAGPDWAAVEAEMDRRNPEVLWLKKEDPDAFYQARAEVELALHSGSSREDAMAKGLTMLQKLVGDRRSLSAPLDKAGEAIDSAAGRSATENVPGARSELEGPGRLGAKIGVEWPRTRKCSSSGPDAECIKMLDDPSSLPNGANGRDAGAATVLKQLDTYSRKANQSREILEKL